ncbi:MAG: outer membrane protein assembly factor BamD, partial [Pedosphaera parvula]|nr:outer membrane protein assembly factor BamD [Pedosphaera parvula]
VEKYPKSTNYDEVLNRQYIIANRYLAGQWFKLWGYIPFFPSMDKTVTMYEKLIKNGPYSEVAPQAQLNIGAAREKQKDFPLAVKAYEKAADRYYEQKDVSAAARFKQGMAFNRQARKAEYDQGAASQAIDTFTAFIALFPEDARVDEARKIIDSLRLEQARGSFSIARFYEKSKRWDGALVYYNDVVNKAPESKFAQEAKKRIEVLKQRAQTTKVAQK